MRERYAGVHSAMWSMVPPRPGLPLGESPQQRRWQIAAEEADPVGQATAFRAEFRMTRLDEYSGFFMLRSQHDAARTGGE